MLKPVTFVTAKEKLDEILKSKITIKYFWGVIKNILESNHVSQKHISKLETELAKSLGKKQKYNPEVLLARAMITAELIPILCKIFEKINSFIPK